MDTATRLLRLLALLTAQPRWRGEDLAKRLEVTPRTIRRDVTRLRALDYPVDAVPGPDGGYRLGRGPDVPPLVLDDEEALAVVLGLRTATVGAADGIEQAATSALAKLERVLPERLGEHLRDVQEATLALIAGPTVPVSPDQLLSLSQACRRRRQVRFRYTSRQDVTALRSVEPFRLVHAARRWYLVAFDLDRDDWRTFRVDRASSVFVTDTVCGDRPTPDALDLVRRARSLTGWPVQGLVWLDLDVEKVRAILPEPFGIASRDPERGTLLEVGGTSYETIAAHLATMPCRVEVRAPEELRRAFDAHLGRLLGRSGAQR